jgi:type II secretory pathway component GspD/PulD (secretin)
MRFTILTIALLLGGCSALSPVPMNHAEDAPTTEKTVLERSRMTEAWNGVPVITEGKSAVVLLTPEALPASIRNKKIALELEPGATVTDVVAVLGRLGITIIMSDKDIASKEFYLPRFNGTLGGFLSAVTKVTDVWFTWHDGTVVASAYERIGVSVPQEEKFGEVLGKGLETLGVKQAKTVAWQAGMAVMDVTPSQFRKVKTYLERMTANAAVISLQLAVVNVTLKQDAKVGIDWQNLSASALDGGTAGDLKNWKSYSGSGTTATSTVTSTAASTAASTVAAAVAEPLSKVTALGLANGALTGAIFSDKFNFSGMFNFLQTYGTAETTQNVMLKTVAGNKVEFKSLTSVPYVSEVGVTTSAGLTASQTGSTKTQKADDGITVEMTPTFDASANSVTVDMKLSIKAVVAFNELSAGNQIGKLTQPTTAERGFTDTLRLRPGQTVVVGGLTYDTYSNNKGAPIFLTGTPLESTSIAVNRQTMFIVVRPTVLKLGQLLNQESGESLDILPVGMTGDLEQKVSTKSGAVPK